MFLKQFLHAQMPDKEDDTFPEPHPAFIATGRGELEVRNLAVRHLAARPGHQHRRRPRPSSQIKRDKARLRVRRSRPRRFFCLNDKELSLRQKRLNDKELSTTESHTCDTANLAQEVTPRCCTGGDREAIFGHVTTS